MKENTLLTEKNMKALEYLVELVGESNINNKDYILDINVNREKRLDILDKLDDILNDISK